MSPRARYECMHRLGERSVSLGFDIYRSLTLRFVFSSGEEIGCSASRSMARFAPPTHEERRIEREQRFRFLKRSTFETNRSKSNEEQPPVPGSLVFSRRGGEFFISVLFCCLTV